MQDWCIHGTNSKKPMSEVRNQKSSAVVCDLEFGFSAASPHITFMKSHYPPALLSLELLLPSTLHPPTHPNFDFLPPPNSLPLPHKRQHELHLKSIKAERQ